MRILLDECVPKRLKRDLTAHDVRTVQEAGWAGVKNGALLKAADGLFDVLLTVDQGIAYQQNLTGLQISVIIMVAASSDVDDSRPLVPLVEQALGGLGPAQSIRLGGQQPAAPDADAPLTRRFPERVSRKRLDR